MPRIRTLKPDLWEDEKFGSLSVWERLLWIGLITQADDEGRLNYRPRIIRTSIYPYDDDVTDKDILRWTEALQECKMVCVYSDECHLYLQITNWTRHQKVSNPSPSKLPHPPAENGDSLEDSRGLCLDMDMEEDKEEEEESSRSSDAHIWVENEPPYDLCEFLIEQMLKNDDRAKVPRNIQKWCVEMDRLMRLDKRTEPEVAAMISFSQNDDFWSGIIHSPAGLRRNFSKILFAAKKAKAPLEIRRDDNG